VGRYATKESVVFKLLILFSVLLVASCATPMKEIPSETEVKIYGAKSKPPQHGIWLLAADTTSEMTFYSEFSKGETIVAHIRSYQLPHLSSDNEFFEHVLKSSGQVTKSPLNSVLCSKNVSMSNEPQIYDADKSEKLMKFMSYHCKHPFKNDVVVYMVFSLKHDISEGYPLFKKHANDFFINIVFTEI